MCLKVVSLFVGLEICAAQTIPREQLIVSAEKLREQGRYAEAESASRSALKEAELRLSPSEWAKVSLRLAALCQIRGDFSQAEELYQRDVTVLGRPTEPVECGYCDQQSGE